MCHFAGIVSTAESPPHPSSTPYLKKIGHPLCCRACCLFPQTQVVFHGSDKSFQGRSISLISFKWTYCQDFLPETDRPDQGDRWRATHLQQQNKHINLSDAFLGLVRWIYRENFWEISRFSNRITNYALAR